MSSGKYERRRRNEIKKEKGGIIEEDKNEKVQPVRIKGKGEIPILLL